MQIEIASRTFQRDGIEMLPSWANQDKINKYRRYADSGLGYTFLKRSILGDTVVETIVWVPKS